MSTSDQNGSQSSNTATKQRKVGIPFKKGDPRINRNGRPRSFDQLRAVAQEISHRQIKTKGGRSITIAEAVLLKLAGADDASSLRTFLEFSFGKVPDELKATGLENKTSLVLRFDHERGITEEARK